MRDFTLIGIGRTPLEDVAPMAALQGLRVVPKAHTRLTGTVDLTTMPRRRMAYPACNSAGRFLAASGVAAGEARRVNYNACCYHQARDELDASWVKSETV